VNENNPQVNADTSRLKPNIQIWQFSLCVENQFLTDQKKWMEHIHLFSNLVKNCNAKVQ
jgi:hypothetical protein